MACPARRARTRPFRSSKCTAMVICALALAAHEMGEHRIVRIAVAAAHAVGVDQRGRPQISKVVKWAVRSSTPWPRAAAARRCVQAHDAVRRAGPRSAPTSRADFEEAHGQRIEVSAGQDMDLGLGFFREAEPQVDEHYWRRRRTTWKTKPPSRRAMRSLLRPRQPVARGERSRGRSTSASVAATRAWIARWRDSCLGRLAVKLRIQRRVVVHLELVVHRERAAAGDDVGEQFGEARRRGPRAGAGCGRASRRTCRGEPRWRRRAPSPRACGIP